MPQIIPETHESSWFEREEFDYLRQQEVLFEYGGHRICTFKDIRSDANFFVALDSSDTPQYVNEVQPMDVKFAPSAEDVKHALHGYRVWKQSSVAFAPTADRIKLKGLASRIFWDYLATKNNVAVTDSQQTQAGYAFWKKILTHGSGYLTAVTDNNYRHNLLTIVSGGDRFLDASHFQYDFHKFWKESDYGKLLRVFVKRDL